MTRVDDVRIGLLGLGTVGAGVVKILAAQRPMLEERAGCRLTLAAIADTDLVRAREGLDLKALPMVGDAAKVLADPAIHVVIELMGGLEPARTFILRALAAGKHVVTANKALLAHHGAELYEEARRRGVTLAFEAAVAGGIPLIRAVKEGLAANRVLSLAGIVNGTCNYILSKMTDEGIDFSLVLKEAQAQGYAEADPTLDIEGMDSAHKLQILVSLAFRTFIDLKDIHTEGITRVTAADIAYARELGYRIKLLAIAKAVDGGVQGAESAGVEVRVHPTMIPATSPLAAVSGVFNGVFLTGDAVGDLMFYGRGAGQLPTASAVWSDALEIARRIAHGIPALALDLPSVGPAPLPLRPMETIRCCYYLRVMAQDKPGVLSRVAGILGEHDISIANLLHKAAGSRAVICASTGNTSASAAAFAARAGLRAFVMVPRGSVALGKLSQAAIHGAKVLMVEGNFDQALDIVRRIAETHPVTLVNSVNPFRLEGQKTGAFEVVDQLGRAPDYHLIPVGNAGNITAYWRGYREYHRDGKIGSLPRMVGFQAAGAAPIYENRVIEEPRTVATAIKIGNPANWGPALEAVKDSHGWIDVVSDEEILRAYRMLAREEGIFMEPASAATLAGLIKCVKAGRLEPGSTVVLTLTGHGLKDPDTALESASRPTTVPPAIDAVLAQLGL